MNFYERDFDKDTVEMVKEKVSIRNKKLHYNNLPVDTGHRWCGLFGELAFKDYLEEKGLKFEYNSMLEDTDKKPWDFKIKDIRLDVKTVSTSYYPKEDYGCNVEKRQFEKEGCDGYVFVRYLLKEDKALVLGWIMKDTFDKLKTEHLKGERINRLVAWTDFYDVPINKLRPLSELWNIK